LQSSHLLPRWYYKRAYLARSSNPNPFVIVKDRAAQTSRQFRQHLLCKACEHRFNVGGEDYVSRVCYQVDASFPLRERPRANASESAAGEAISIDDGEAARLCYFATSVIWRGAVMKDGDVRLGPVYGEQLRRYLLGESPFPSSARMTALLLERGTLATSMDRIAMTPITARVGRHHRHVFIICGLEFALHVGGELPDELNTFCMATGGYRFLRVAPPESSPLAQAVVEAGIRALRASRRKATAR
jgi:hypothetical protein